MKEISIMNKLAALILLALTACASAQPAPYPITINSQAPTAPQVQTFRASPITFRVQFMDGTNVANLTGSTSNDVFFSWSTSSTSSTRVAASARIHNATNGQAEFTLAASNLNYQPGRYLYECGVSNAVVRQGVMLLNGSPFGAGASPISFATNVNWNLISWQNLPAYITDAPADASTYGRKSNAWVAISAATATNGINAVSNATPLVGTLEFANNILTLSITGATSGASGAITGNQHNAILGGLTVSNTISADRLLGMSSLGIPILALNGTTSAVFGVGGSAAVVFGSGATFNGVINGNGGGITNVNATLLGGLADTAFLKTTGINVLDGFLTITNGQLSVYRLSGQLQIFDPTGSNGIQFNASVAGGTYISFKHNSTSHRLIFDSATTSFVFGSSTPASLSNIDNVSAISFTGNGAGLTNVFTIATNGSGNAVTNITFGGNVITQQMGTISGGGGGASVAPEILGFSRWEGSSAGWHVDSFAPSIDDVSTTTATNLDLYQHFVYSTSLTTITNTIAGRFTTPVTNHFQFKFRANQAGEVAVVSMFDGSAVAVITQSIAAAATTYTTNAPIPSGAVTNFSIEFRYATTNAANPVRIGVGK